MQRSIKALQRDFASGVANPPSMAGSAAVAVGQGQATAATTTKMTAVSAASEVTVVGGPTSRHSINLTFDGFR